MARPAIVTYDAVRRCCLKMLGEGEWPTNQAIYEALGRKGGMGTIQKHKTAFLDSLRDRGFDALPAALPKELVPLIEEWWSISVRHAGEAHSEERKHLLQQVDDQERLNENLNETIVALDEKRARLESELEGKERELSFKQSELEGALGVALERQNQIDELKAQLDVLRTDHAAYVVELKGSQEAQLQQFEDRIFTLKQELATSLEREKTEVARSERNADHFLLQLREERDRYQVMESHYKATVDRLDSELVIYRARENRLIQSQQDLETRFETLESEFTALQTREATLATESQELRLENARLTRELESLKERVLANDDDHASDADKRGAGAGGDERE